MVSQSDALPRCVGVRAFLETFRGCAAFRPPLANETGKLVGNNGDRLIALGADKILREYGIRQAPAPEIADLIVLDGGGGMHDRYRVVPQVFSFFARLYPKVPLVMLPASFFLSSGQLREMIGTRDAPVVLFCREKYSFNRLLQDNSLPKCCKVELDHDMAFELANDPLVKRLEDREARHILFVERLDSEHINQGGGRSGLRMAQVLIGRWAPSRIKKMLYPVAGRMLGRRRTDFADKCHEMLSNMESALKKMPIVSADISLPNLYEFENFLCVVAESHFVFTNRLHVGILSTILSRKTYLFEASYFKVRGIYEHSLSGMSNVRLVSASEQLA